MSLNAQEEDTSIVLNDCPRYNAFIKPSISYIAQQNLDSLSFYADTIHPDGYISLDPDKLDSTQGIPHLYDFLGVGSSDYSFVPEIYKNGILDSNELFIRYSEYYKGLRVEGGGYTAGYYIPSGPTSPPGSACEQFAFMISPYILDSINLDTTPSVSKSSLIDTLGIDSFETSELIFTYNISGNCNYNLVWHVNYYDTIEKIAWIDAHTGQTLNTQDVAVSFNCPGGEIRNAQTEIYGYKDLCNKVENGITYLESPTSSIKVYDLFPVVRNCRAILKKDFDESLIPKTTKTFWDPSDYDPGLYQAFHVGAKVQMAYLNKLGLDFNTLHIGVNCESFSASGVTYNYNYRDGINNPLIGIGFNENTGDSKATYDIVAHELGHSTLGSYGIFRGTFQSKTLHEGISDILATYVESEIQGYTDWVLGDDINSDDRDLQEPFYYCINDQNYKNETDEHKTGTLIGHWYYLACAGNTANGFSTITLEKAIKVILHSLNFLPPDPTVKQFRDRTLIVTSDEYGSCSDEFEALAAAWEEVCVGTFSGKCDMELDGPRIVCEESDTLKICINGGPVTWYYWTISGKKSTMYDIMHQGTGQNYWTGGDCLNIIDFPKYPYYPQAITIKVKFKASGEWKYFRQRIILRDCNLDDPTCEEYHSGDKLMLEDRYNHPKLNSSFVGSRTRQDKTIENQNKVMHIEVYDMIGKLMFAGNPSQFDNFIKYNSFNQILIKIEYDEYFNIIKSAKFLK